MKLINTFPVAFLLLSASVGCSDDSGGTVTGTGGTIGAGAGTATGGMTAAGGATAGGTTGGAAGMTGGAAGAATGGSGAGGAAAGGSGAGGSTGGMAPLDEDTLVPGLNGLFWPLRANNSDDTGSFKYWLTASDACPAEGATVTKEFTAMGDPTQEYTIGFEVRGALALHCYEGGTPTAMTADAAGINEAFYVGGMPSGDAMVSTIALTVSPDVATAEANTYYLNGIPATSEMCDEGITYDVQYKGSFKIMGDSTVTLSFMAPGCQAMQNCGADPATCAPREINVDGLEVRASSPQPVSDFFFVDDAELELFPQWLAFDIQTIDMP